MSVGGADAPQPATALTSTTAASTKQIGRGVIAAVLAVVAVLAVLAVLRELPAQRPGNTVEQNAGQLGRAGPPRIDAFHVIDQA